MTPTLGWLGRTHLAHRHAVLFYTLLLTLAASPILTALGFGGQALQIVLAFTLLVALLGVPGHRRRMLVLALAAVAVGLRVVPASTIGQDVATGALLLCSALAVVAGTCTIRFALGSPVIDAEHVYAALSTYLLGGFFFGVLHWAVAITWPGSLADPAAGDPEAPLSLSTAIYYSFVTLATLGYGDVVPRTEVARGLAIFEAVVGQLYIAVTIARLVGGHLQASGR